MKIRYNYKKFFYLLICLICFAFSGFSQFKNRNMNRALIISGGGSKVSWGAGFIKGLVEKEKLDYKIVGGTSAGALIMGQVALNGFEKLEKVFETMTNKDVYNVCPFRKNGRIRTFKSFGRLLFGHSSFGETKNLRKYIEQNLLTKQDYEKILRENKTIFCSTTDLNTSKAAIKSINTSSYEDMLDWIWASTSFHPIMEPVKKNNITWVDGGLTNDVPIDSSVIKKAKIIDVVILFSEKIPNWESSNKFSHILGRSFTTLIESNFRFSLSVGKLMADLEEGTQLNLYYMSEEDVAFFSNSFSFTNEILSEGFQRGYNAYEKMIKKTFICGKDSMSY